jgi:ketosteroid isomerase-like protein
MTVGDQAEGATDRIDVGAILRIQRALAAYCQLCDDAEFWQLAQVFAPDGVFVFAGAEVTGRDALAAWFERAQPPRRRGKHFTTNAIVDVDPGGDTASAVSDFVFVQFIDGAPKPQIAGRYRDKFVRFDGDWLIERREVETMTQPVISW